MKQDHRKTKNSVSFLKYFPTDIHPTLKVNQRAALINDEGSQGSNIQELPTGTGKTAKGYTNLLALRDQFGEGLYFYITPNKALVDQIKNVYPEFHIIYGRNEYDCFYYTSPKLKADQVPCSFLDECPSRVNQETGETHESGASRCPYLDAKFKAKQSTLVVCTMSFYLFSILFNPDQWGEIKGVVVDEAHKIAEVIRNALSYEITDYHLIGIIDFLTENGIEGRNEFKQFLSLMKRTVKKRGYKDQLLNEQEVNSFIHTLNGINRTALKNELKRVLRLKRIDDQEKIEFIKKLEMILRDLHRYITSFEYSIETESRKALNYTYAYIRPQNSDNQRANFGLSIKSYYVVPIIKKIFPVDRTFYMSATIGSIEAFRMETGLEHPFFTHASEFPIENTRIYLPSDSIDLSMAKAKKRSKASVMRKIISTCKLFNENGQRCLMLVASEEERQQFLNIAETNDLKVITYNKDLPAKAAILEFKRGTGDVLLGTFSQYGEGIDLPGNIASVTFVLRPSYPPPSDPKALFETRRFKSSRWVIWNGKEMQRILQARGRNVRSEADKGVTFCMSSQYKKIVLKALPKWLLPAYVYTKTFDDCVNDALSLLCNDVPMPPIN